MHTRSDILTRAEELFSERGYHGASMRELARMLDLREASLYAHITSKEEMLWETVSRAADQFLAQAEAIPQTLSLEEQLALLVRGHLRVIAYERHCATVFFHEWQFLGPALRRKAKARRDAYESYFYVLIERGARQGLFQVSNPRLATLFVLSALNWTYQWLHVEEVVSVERLTDQYVGLILSALKGGLSDIKIEK